jgi:glycosyltransferase involved in cell wall biosynthesis
MEISVLTADVSHNCLGRAYLLARVLQRRYEVEIVGPAFAGEVWKPLAGQDDVRMRIVPAHPAFYNTISLMRAIAEKTTGEVIYASKPLLTSYGAALLGRASHARPVVLDIDDWQMGFQREALRNLTALGKLRRFARSVFYLSSPASYWTSLLGERLATVADAVTVSSSFLQARFGGTVVPHGRDTNVFNPRQFDKEALRLEFKISKDRKVVSFIGTPLPYKGIEDLIDAIDLLKDHRFLLMLVGLSNSPYSTLLRDVVAQRLGAHRAALFGLRPFADLPKFLAVSDVVVLPQRSNRATLGQVPAKVFDAMAMAKPIIATRVSDLPQILLGCGWIVDPEDPQQLAEAIRYVFDHPAEAREMGCRARERCIQDYSWDALEGTLVGIFCKYE